MSHRIGRLTSDSDTIALAAANAAYAREVRAPQRHASYEFAEHRRLTHSDHEVATNPRGCQDAL